MTSKILVIAPHADDEVLGCGATMAKYAAEGDEVFVWIATNASKGAPGLFRESDIEKIREEAQKAHQILGVKATFFSDFPAPALNAFPSFKISLHLSGLINKIRPNILYLPHPGDLHEDHQVIYRSALVAARPINNSPIRNILCYETLSETEWAPIQNNEPFKPNYYQSVNGYFAKKLEAMQEFKSQLKAFPHSRSLEALTALAKLRGATVGVHYAEAFEVERIIT